MLWTQPEDSQIFASFRDDVPASSSLFGAPDDDGGVDARVDVGRRLDARVTRCPTSPSPSASPSASPLTIPARTANQSICAG